MKRALDAYGLPGRILVRLHQDWCGNVTVKAVSKRWARRVGKSNAFDGSDHLFLQDPSVYDFGDTFPKSAFYRDSRGDKRWNSGVRFYLDSWTFRHLVGGQSD